MVRVAATGMIDFSKFDPWDAWWWKKVKWMIDEFETQQKREVSQIRHTHWVTLASHGRLTSESFDEVKTNAGTALNEYLKATYPWLADKIGDTGTHSDREQAIATYQETFGKPGDPHYEMMISTLQEELKRKPTARQKEKNRKARRERRRAMMETT